MQRTGSTLVKHKYITLTLVTHIPKSNYLSAAISYSNISHSLLSLNHLSNFKNISTNQFQRTSFCLLHSDAAPPPPPLFSRNHLTTSASPHHRRSVLFAPWSLLFWPDFFCFLPLLIASYKYRSVLYSIAARCLHL